MIKTSKADQAVECFNRGYNCAQAILSTYCEQFGLDRESALKLSCGFGAGMGRLQETCGAVTGAYLVIGLSCSEDKEKTYRLVREFSERFKRRCKTTNCYELLGIDLEDGNKELARQRVHQVCPQAVYDAAEILESILEL